MAWVKRNLFFVVVVILAVGLLAVAGIYFFKNWQRNNKAMSTLNEAYSALSDLNNQNPSPGNDKVDNIEAARQQEKEVRAWIAQATNYFQPIAPIPTAVDGHVSSEAFAGALRRTIDSLQHEAQNASVLLPPQYNFSFEAERSLVKFAPDSLLPLSVQLGEVKAIAEILFAAKINSLDNIRRARVSADDANGSQSDYFDSTSTTNDLAVITPYEITFRCFSQDLASVLSKLSSSANGFIVKGINVQRASTAGSSAPAGPNNYPYGAPPPGMMPPPAIGAAPGANVVGRGGLQTVLNEQLLSVTLDLDIVKLLPKK
ncbi:MAG TPA: Amuc_1100 family pilus-like protein [Verrucomicrobiae bacterium]|nr:Amuc_1100 family pilus-like protein [Verrucomicrobiae bacterium]